MKKLIEAEDPEEEPYETELVSSDDDELVVKAIHRRERAGAARTGCPRPCSSSTEYRHLVEVHAELLKQVGRPAVQGHARRAKRREADSFDELRRAVLELARQGVTLQRFKGLGEMNAEQLRETTMDPASRTLQRVTIEDARDRRAHLRRPDGRQGRAAQGVHRAATPRTSGSSMSSPTIDGGTE